MGSVELNENWNFCSSGNSSISAISFVSQLDGTIIDFIFHGRQYLEKLSAEIAQTFFFNIP